MKVSRLVTLGGMIAVLLAVSACHRHFIRHHHGHRGHHSDAGTMIERAPVQPAAATVFERRAS